MNDYTKGVNPVIGLIVDSGVPSLGHRRHLLATAPFDTVFVEAAAGYGVNVPGGTHDVTCSGGGFAGTASAQVTVIGFNRQVDCISGRSAAWVEFVPEPGGAALGLTAVGALAAVRRVRRPA
jgi:hypothetical protein